MPVKALYLQVIYIKRHHLSVSVNLVFAEETLSVQHLVSITTEVVFRIKQQVFQYYSVYPPDVCVGNLCVSSDELSERGKV